MAPDPPPRSVVERGAHVLAIGTSPRQALDAAAVLRAVVPEAGLVARPVEDLHYGRERGFRFVELDADDRIEGPLGRTMTAFDERNSAHAGGSVFAFVDPVSVIMVVVGAIGAGAASAVGKDLYEEGKRRVRGGAHAAPSETDSALGRLFDELGVLYESGYVSHSVVLLRVLDPDVAFLVEADLPREARAAAVALVLAHAGRPEEDRPLRYDRRRRRWRPMPDDWFDERALRRLGRDLGR